MLKDIVIHVNDSDASTIRTRLGVRLAQQHEARLFGVATVPPPPVALYAAGVPAVPIRSGAETAAASEESAEQRLERARARFREVTESSGLECRCFELRGQPFEVLALHGRFADLVIVGQADPQSAGPDWNADLALAVGRPVLFVPRTGEWEHLGQRVLVGWNASREAARAVHDALPLLRKAERVTVASFVTEVTAGTRADLTHLDIVEHLRAHGVAAESLNKPKDERIGNELLKRAADLDCDLLVMGAYGHSRLRELVFGGATREVLREMTLPTLMSH